MRLYAEGERSPHTRNIAAFQARAAAAGRPVELRVVEDSSHGSMLRPALQDAVSWFESLAGG